MEGNVKTLGILWIIYGALGALMGIFVFAFFFGLSFLPNDYEGPLILRSLAIGGGGLITILSLPEIIAGYALLKFKEWGRILTLAVAFLNLIWFPLGTALGIYSIITLLKDESIALFRSN